MKYRIEMFRWLDSVSHSGWQTLPDDRELEDNKHLTVGFLIRETENVVVVTNSHSEFEAEDTKEMVNDVMTIPKAAIVERRVILEAD